MLKNFQMQNLKFFNFKNVDFGDQKFSPFLPGMVKFDLSIFQTLIFCLSSYDLDKPSGS